MSEDRTDQPRDPGRRRALKIIGGTVGGAVLTGTGFLAGRVTAPVPDAPKPAVITGDKIKNEGVRQTVDLSLKDFVSLSHKEQDQKLESLKGKNVNLLVDTESTLERKGGAFYYKDGTIKGYNAGDKTQDKGQIVKEVYILWAKQKEAVKQKGGEVVGLKFSNESTGLRFMDVGALYPVSISGAYNSKDSAFVGKPGFYTNYSAYSDAFREANYRREYMENLWEKTDHYSKGDETTRVLPTGTVLKLSFDSGIYSRVSEAGFLEANLPPQTGGTK